MPTRVFAHLSNAVKFLQNGITETSHNPNEWDVTIDLHNQYLDDSAVHAIVRAFLYISPVHQINRGLGRAIRPKVLPYGLKILLDHNQITTDGMNTLGNLLRTHTHLPK